MKNIKFKIFSPLKGGRMYQWDEVKEWDFRFFKSSDYIFLLFSHHLDREKTEIYEGDILEFSQFSPHENKDVWFIGEVYYDYSNSALRIRTKSGLKGFFPLENAKIIGNMCQSPEKFI